MPNDLDDNFADMPSSEHVDLDGPAEQAVADSSPATGEEPKDTLSIVRDVVGGDASEAEGSPPEEAAKADTPDVEDHKQPDNENYSDVPFNKHPRFQQLLRESKAYKADAEQYRTVERFLSDNGLTAQDAAEVLRLRALMNSNKAEAWKILRPIAEKLAIDAGVILPPDLQQRVQAGHMTREAALELSQAVAGRKALEQQREWESQRQQQVQAEQMNMARAQTVETWKSERAMRDPNFAAKEQAIQKELFFMTGTRGEPKTPAEIVAMLNEAYQNVNSALPAPAPAQAAPRPKPAVKPVTGGQVAGNTRSEPTSTLDIIKQRIGRG